MNGRKILIVHAAAVMRMIVKNTLTAGGFDVVGEAADASEALKLYRTLLPDVVTMDMILHESDGVSAVKAIVSEFPQALIVMCTGTGHPSLVVEAMEAGAKGYVAKPFPPVKLVEAVRKILT